MGPLSSSEGPPVHLQGLTLNNREMLLQYKACDCSQPACLRFGAVVRKRPWFICFTPIKEESKAGIMADAFNPSIREAEASGVQAYCGLQSESHIVRPCPKINKQKQMNKQTKTKN